MKRSVLFKFLAIFTCVYSLQALSPYLYSQLPNSNMSLIANKNDHFTSTLYSAVWGYTADNGREYAILGCPNGTAFYDVTDTTNIVECDFLPGVTSSWREMKTFGKY